MHYIPSLLAAAMAITPILALPADSGSLDKRGDPPATYGDLTGSTSALNDQFEKDPSKFKYVKSIDQWTYRPSGDYCWTDLFAHELTYEAVGWQKVTEIDCRKSSTCASGFASAQQDCASYAVGITRKFDVDLEIFKTGLDISFTYTSQTCNTATSTNTCTWNDQGCHGLWVAKTNAIAHGFIRRRCNFVRGKHETTVWAKDMTTTSPTNMERWGCAADCQTTKYPEDVPALPAGHLAAA